MKKINIALLGSGKTGSFIQELCQERDDLVLEVFNSARPLTLEDARSADVIISFLTGEVFQDYLALLLQAKKPIVIGSTGFQFPADIQAQLERQKITWVHATNFALGMTLVKQMIEVLAHGRNLFADDQVIQKIHEVHHTKKLDAPSGTALSWHQWAGSHGEITSERIGDVIGEHELVFETPFESITLKHSAKNRRVFAEGALWAALQLARTPDQFAKGLLDIHQLTRISLKETSKG